MILGPISLIDCVVFVIFLLPNLLVVAGLRTLVLVKVLPFLLLKLPYQFFRERYLTKKEKRSCLCPESLNIRGYCHSMRQVCIREHSSWHWKGFLFKMGGIPFSSDFDCYVMAS